MSILLHQKNALSGEGVFVQPEPGVWANTQASESLLDPSFREIVHFFAGAWYRAFGESLHTVRTGEAAFSRAFGSEWWAWLEEHPAEQERFDRAMHGDTHVDAVAALAWGDETVVDVGGGTGALLIGLLQRHERLRGVLFDRERTADAARALVAEAGLADRLRVEAGDFFERVPPGDVHVLSGVLHDWDDEPAAAILRRLGDRVLIVEGVLDEQAPEPEFAWFDLLMLVLLRGRERTETQWRELLAAAGYRLERVHDGGVIEAVRA